MILRITEVLKRFVCMLKYEDEKLFDNTPLILILAVIKNGGKNG